MRLDAILSEATRNLSSETSHAGRFALALTALTLVAGLTDARTVAQLDERSHTFLQAGGATYIFEAVGAVNPVACEGQAELDGITASGAVRIGEEVSAKNLPGRSLRHFEATPGFSPVLQVDVKPGGIMLAADFAEELGLRVGDTMRLDDGSGRLSATFAYPSDGRDPRLAAAVVSIVAPSGGFDECWSQVWPPPGGTPQQMRTVATAAAGEVRIRQLNPTLGETFTGPADFASRPTRWAPHLAATAAALLGVAWIVLRRRELLMARTLGVPRWALILQIQAEASIILTLGVGLGIVCSRAMLLDEPETWSFALAPAGATAAGWLLAATTATALLRTRQLLHAVKFD